MSFGWFLITLTIVLIPVGVVMFKYLQGDFSKSNKY